MVLDSKELPKDWKDYELSDLLKEENEMLAVSGDVGVLQFCSDVLHPVKRLLWPAKPSQMNVLLKSAQTYHSSQARKLLQMTRLKLLFCWLRLLIRVNVGLTIKQTICLI